jgi:hypothetical protein
MSGADASRLYQLYCRYVDELNQALRTTGDRHSDVSVASHTEFINAWNSLSESHRESWRKQFELGHEEVAKRDRLKLLEAFTANRPTFAHVRFGRAA